MAKSKKRRVVKWAEMGYREREAWGKKNGLDIRAINVIMDEIEIDEFPDPIDVFKIAPHAWLRVPNCGKVTLGRIRKWLTASGLDASDAGWIKAAGEEERLRSLIKRQNAAIEFLESQGFTVTR